MHGRGGQGGCAEDGCVRRGAGDRATSGGGRGCEVVVRQSAGAAGDRDIVIPDAADHGAHAVRDSVEAGCAEVLNGKFRGEIGVMA